MQILGIDTSGKVAAAALYDTEQHCIKRSRRSTPAAPIRR